MAQRSDKEPRRRQAARPASHPTPPRGSAPLAPHEGETLMKSRPRLAEQAAGLKREAETAAPHFELGASRRRKTHRPAKLATIMNPICPLGLA